MKVLAIGAYQDDEIYATGYLAKRAAEGDEVYLRGADRIESFHRW